jgi:hypothetical protein
MFGNKKETSATIAASINAITQSFTSMVASLKQKSEEAQALKDEKTVEMNLLKVECEALETEKNRALKLAEKIENLIN